MKSTAHKLPEAFVILSSKPGFAVPFIGWQASSGGGTSETKLDFQPRIKALNPKQDHLQISLPGWAPVGAGIGLASGATKLLCIVA